MSVAWGLDRDRALRAMTINAATILGVADRVGTLEAGKVANLFIANGDPLEMKTQFTHVFINGRSVGLEEQTHRALRALLLATGGEVMKPNHATTKDSKDTKTRFVSALASCSSRASWLPWYLGDQQEAPYIVRDHRRAHRAGVVGADR